MSKEYIQIRGAKQHNLKNISLDIPRNHLVVITGLSGSGKSSLAFDTIYAEGQRRYVESLSAYARQFLDRMDKPEVDSIEGLSPAIAIKQRSASKNPRSTVGTITEIYDYLRVLFARIGKPHCPQCNMEITSQTPQQIVEQIMNLPEGTRIQILAPLIEGRKGGHSQLINRLRKDGFTRARIDGQIKFLDEEIILDKNQKHKIDAVVDRLVIKKAVRGRLTDTVELALSLADGKVIADIVDTDGKEIFFSEKAVCPKCGFSVPDMTPQMFSFNNPRGACPECNGLGTKRYFAPDLVVPDTSLSLRDGAVQPWANRHSVQFQNMLESLCRHYGVTVDTPFKKLPAKVQNVILYGSGKEKIKFYFDMDDGKRHFHSHPFEGIITSLERRYHETSSYQIREEIEKFMNIMPCPACGGARLRPVSLAVLIGGKSIYDISRMSIKKAFDFFENLRLTQTEEMISNKILKEIKDRLTFLLSVGLYYLTCDRATSTLSGGEEQRIHLATQISSGLAGVLYVLDEPSIGLHQRDNQRLLKNLKNLKELGNTVIVVEHDADTMLSADHIIDMGPGAGIHGGEIMFQGPPRLLLEKNDSLTGQYLSGKKQIPIPVSRRKGSGKVIEIRGAKEHNLKDITVKIPLGTLTCITGVSGSGKSSLVNSILYPALCKRLYNAKAKVGSVDQIKGVEHIDKVINIDQAPIGRTPRSNPATYTGIFTHIRELFSRLPESRARGYKPGRFSFNVKGGRCEACKGDGILKIEMHFLPDVYVKCDVCNGMRYNRDTLEIKYRGYTIADILGMTVKQAFSFFDAIPAIKTRLKTLIDVGLGYITLGQQATTLSGGEAQRIKLSRELSKRDTGKTLYLLDEPTTGLHFNDIEKLLDVLNRLVELKNTVVIIEHNMDVIKACDHIIDLGPEGGDEGGQVVGTGTPEEIAQTQGSYTGHFLKEILQN